MLGNRMEEGPYVRNRTSNDKNAFTVTGTMNALAS